MKSAFHTIGSEKGTVVSPLLSYMHVLSLPTTLRSRIIIMPFSRLRFFISFASFLFNGCKFTHFPRNTQTIRNFFSLYPFRLLFLSSFSLFAFRFPLYFRNFAIKDGELTPSRQKKETSFFVLRSIFRNFAANYRLLHYYKYEEILLTFIRRLSGNELFRSLHCQWQEDSDEVIHTARECMSK
jgi:hypothetical protein